MKKLCILCLFITIFLSFNIVAFAAEFDDSYCDNEFNGEKLWKSNIKNKNLYGQKLDSENGIYNYDWVHQIWDKNHKQLYVQERYTVTVNMKPINVNKGEFLDSMSYYFKVYDNSSNSKLYAQYKTIDEIPTPDGYKRKNIKVSGYDAVYIYTEGKTEGNGDGIVSQAYNRGNIYVPLIDAPNETGRIYSLEITASLSGESHALYDSMIGEYMGIVESLPLTIKVDKEEKEFKKGALTTIDSDSSKEEKSSPIVPIVIAAVAVAGADVVVKTKVVKKGTKKTVDTKKPEKTEQDIKHEKYVDKLKEKYGYDDEKELKKEIMSKQIHNEKLGYIAQADMAYADAALDTAEKSKKVADVSADMIGEFGGKKGKIFKNIYTGLTESAEAAGEIIAGKDADKAITEAVLDTSVGIIKNQADGFKQKYVAYTSGEGAKEFAKTYMNTDGDVIKAIDATNEALQDGTIDAVIDSSLDAVVGKAASKAVTGGGKKAVRKTLEEGVNASKAMTQDLIKDSVKK